MAQSERLAVTTYAELMALAREGRVDEARAKFNATVTRNLKDFEDLAQDIPS